MRFKSFSLLFILFFIFVSFTSLQLSIAQEETDDGADEELVMEFKRFYHPRRSVREKIEAVYVLKDANSLIATQALVEAFDDKAVQVRQAAVDTIGSFKTDPESVQFLIDQFLLNKRERGEQRIACAIESLGLMGNESAAEHLLELYPRVKSWDLKRCIGMSLGRLKSEKGLPVLGFMIKDKDPTLKVVALDALALINKPDSHMSPPDEEGNPVGELCKNVILKTLKDSNWQVRASAIAAIQVMRFKEAVQALIDCMRDEKGRLRGDAYEVLKEITFTQFQDDADVWQKYWDRVKDRFVVPDLAKILEDRKKRKNQGNRYVSATAEFAGIPTKSRKIIFVIDTSGSMETQVVEIDRFREGGRSYRSFQRLEIVKQELIDTVASFDGTVQFNILAFASKCRWWKKGLVRSNILNKNSAQDFVKKLKPIGGAAAGFKARSGLKGTAVQEGKTNTYSALMAALGASEDPDEDISKKTFKKKVDTIYFLSDGQPTVGRVIDVAEIREMVRRVNQVRKVIIHAIAIGDFQKTFMESLARENGGVYVDLGK